MWSLYKNEESLKPLTFSNGKTQENVVDEALKLIKEGTKVIFIKGMCGTGKSAIALNIANQLGKTSVVVPGKSLQNQYKKDYEKEKYLLKGNSKRLKISVITGRNNHECAFIKTNESAIPKIKREVNSKLNDIFEFDPKEIEDQRKKDKSADSWEIPCKIDIRERNFRKIKEYLKQNKNLNLSNILNIQDVKRLPLASVCPYWSPVLPDVYDLKNLDYTQKRSYMGLNDTKFIIYQRRPGCSFYEQFNSYIDSDVIVFNSLKYKLESALNRKPLTEAEIIDECDEFLDSFTNQRHINIDRMQSSLIQFLGNKDSHHGIVEELSKIISYIKSNSEVNNAINSRGVVPLKRTGIYDIIKILNDENEFSDEIDEESYLFEIKETARMFEDFLDEAYVIFSKRENNFVVTIVTTNLSKKFQELVDKNKIVILMSGTLHSEDVLRDVFGISNFKIIEAETVQPGTIEIMKTGAEFDCKYENFRSGKYSRRDYLEVLNECVKIAKKPTLVHVSAFSDLPDEYEIEHYNLNYLQNRDEMRDRQREDKHGREIEEFKEGKIDILFTTRASRGVDFPGEQCNSIVFTKYPNPNPEEPFWKILRQTNPNQYWEFYRDKSKRELLQKVYRGVRFKEDHVYLLSPDVRVLDAFKNS
jgi:Rad3-related DNA helicase